MTKTNTILIIFAVMAVMCVAFFVQHKKSHALVTLGSVTYDVTLAETSFEQGRGLGGRAHLSQGEGMLFVFQNPDRYSFWMKDMNFPIDILWFDTSGTLMYIKENALPGDYPSLYEPPSPAAYVLEISAGEISKNHFSLGDKMTIGIAR